MFDLEKLTLNAYNYHFEQRDDEASAIIEHVLKREPTYTFALIMKGIIALSLGDYKTGWPLFELLNQRSDAKKFGMDRYPDTPMWDGRRTDETVLIWCSMGLGDMLMMWRYLPYIEALAPNIILETHSELFRLALDNEMAPEIVSLKEHNKYFKYHWPLMSSPYLFDTTLDTILPSPYLRAKPRENYKGPKLGLFCQSIPPPGMLSDESLVRNLDQSAVDRLCERYKFIALHKADLKTFDMLETARYIKALDLVVTTDLAVAHLCGALGKKTFLMLPVKCCWRWLRGRSDSPWYSSIRIFRQKTPRDWGPVVDEVLQALDEEGIDNSFPGETLQEEIKGVPYNEVVSIPRTTQALGRSFP